MAYDGEPRDDEETAMAARRHHHEDGELEDHDRGLAFDLGTLLNRRGMLGLIAGAGVLGLAACGGAESSASGTASASSSGTASAGADADSCSVIPEETAGPFPGDGSNGPDVLSESGIVRRDIRSSFGSASGVAQGVPLTITMTVVDASNGCAAMEGSAVYVWHCNRDGEYSLYGQAVQDQNYLRGVQEADASGQVSFTSIFPAAYSGRWPHIHFEVYQDVDAIAAGQPVATSQIALPEAICRQVYATDGYGQSASNLAQTSLATDNVFSDGWQTQLGTMTGRIDSGLTVALTVPVQA
jgi:protocatechuate 3,4-dioxygenase beta subunit